MVMDHPQQQVNKWHGYSESSDIDARTITSIPTLMASGKSSHFWTNKASSGDFWLKNDKQRAKSKISDLQALQKQ